MTDPRNTDPHRREHQLSEPVRRQDTRMWGWIAGIAVVVLVAFIIIVGWNSGGPTDTASSPPATTTGQAPATGGAGAPAPSPAPGSGSR